MTDASLVFDRSDDITFDFPIIGSGSVVQEGGGKLTLTAVDDFTGPTQILEGELQVDGSIASSQVTVNNGGTLSGTGATGNVVVYASAVSVGHQGEGTLTVKSLELDSDSSFNVDLSDTGGGCLDVNVGTVTLDGATLHVTSSRNPTDPSGVLRVLIRNEGGNAVSGTFSDLSEGDTISVDGVTYWITYHYDAATGQFDDGGHDVALVSTLFNVVSAPADPYVITPAQQSPVTRVLDADRTTYTSAFMAASTSLRNISRNTTRPGPAAAGNSRIQLRYLCGHR